MFEKKNTMVTKELLKSEIDNVTEEGLEQPTNKTSEESLMSKLRRISIDGPPDLSENIDAYLNGEKELWETFFFIFCLILNQRIL